MLIAKDTNISKKKDISYLQRAYIPMGEDDTQKAAEKQGMGGKYPHGGMI